MKKVIFLCDFELPVSCANATRVWNLVKILKRKFEIGVFGVSYHEDTELEGCYNGIPYVMLKAPLATGWQAGRRIRYLNGEIQKVLRNEIENNDIQAIVVSNVYFDYARTLINLSRYYKVPLIVNSVEWYEKDNSRFDGLLGKIRFIENRIALMYYHVKMRNIIAISSLLSDYYSSKKCNVITIPTIVDMNEYANVHYDEDVRKNIVIAYAGSPARKDYIGNAIIALTLLDENERKAIEMHFYGADIESFRIAGLSAELLEKVRDNVVYHGRVPYESVKNAIGNADFTILLRPNKRYANAGFPTKVGESMACGTPIIGNITSDLGKYYIDGKNAVVCEDETPEACANAIKRCIALSVKERKNMREEAKDTANIFFNYERYSEGLISFTEKATV